MDTTKQMEVKREPLIKGNLNFEQVTDIVCAPVEARFPKHGSF